MSTYWALSEIQISDLIKSDDRCIEQTTSSLIVSDYGCEDQLFESFHERELDWDIFSDFPP
jgi:hypothetical protein